MLAGPDGAPLALRHLGGEGPALLMSHATGLHGHVWAPMAAHLSSWSCHAVDLRGHGLSPVPASDDLAWDGMGRDAALVADHLGPGLVGVGHSAGATALLMAAAAHPERFELLVLFEPALRLGPDPVPPALTGGQRALVERTTRRRAVFSSRAEALATFARKPPFDTVTAAALHAYVEHGFADTDDGQVTLRCLPEVEAQVFARAHGHDLARRLHEVTCPVVVVRGDESAPHQIAASDALGEVFGRPTLVLDGADHFGPLSQPSRVARIVRDAVVGIGLADVR